MPFHSFLIILTHWWQRGPLVSYVLLSVSLSCFPTGLILLPASVFFATVLTQIYDLFKYSDYQIYLISGSAAFGSFYPVFNSLATLFVIKSYRLFLFQIFRKARIILGIKVSPVHSTPINLVTTKWGIRLQEAGLIIKIVAWLKLIGRMVNRTLCPLRYYFLFIINCNDSLLVMFWILEFLSMCSYLNKG